MRYGLDTPERGCDLERMFDEMEDSLLPGFLQIGRDPGANGFVLDTNNGAVYYWDSGGFFEVPGALYPMARNFTELLGSLSDNASR